MHIVMRTLQAVEMEHGTLECRLCCGMHKSEAEHTAWCIIFHSQVLPACVKEMCTFTVEAHVIAGWPAAVDIYEFRHAIIFQVDGAQHLLPKGRDDDVRFNSLAVQ